VCVLIHSQALLDQVEYVVYVNNVVDDTKVIGTFVDTLCCVVYYNYY
jgi:hypothetical protein